MALPMLGIKRPRPPQRPRQRMFFPGVADSPQSSPTTDTMSTVATSGQCPAHLSILPPQKNMYNLLLGPRRATWTNRRLPITSDRLLGSRIEANYLIPSRFIGKTGGEIFHEMMLRHDVKHICLSPSPQLFVSS